MTSATRVSATLPSPLGTFYPRFGKRVVDIVLASASGVLLLPILLVIAIGILCTDPGPVIFRQSRVGRFGRLFVFYKFRSMPVGTKNVSSDQLGIVELTWFGKLLRRSNLDELPQLYNILKGDMSLVGPRPPIPAQDELVRLRSENGALACRPGLTGLAQVNAYDGMSVAEKARFDGQYASTVSLKLDLSVIVRTFSYLRKPPPAY